MPQAVTDHGAAAFLSAAFGVTSAPAAYFIALVDGAPGNDADGTIIEDLEPNDPAYRRVSVDALAAAWLVNGNYLGNAADIDFGVAAVDWGYLDHFVLCDSASAGEIYAYGELSEPQYVEADSQVIIPAGSLVLALVPLDDTVAI